MFIGAWGKWMIFGTISVTVGLLIAYGLVDWYIRNRTNNQGYSNNTDGAVAGESNPPYREGVISLETRQL
jgi:hypothetical protein